jgi:nucleotide-binding universal stress UspA family protein
MKTILVPTEDHDSMPAALEAARLMASLFDSYVEGIAVRPAAEIYVTVEPVSGLAMSSGFDADTAQQVRAQFEGFWQGHNVARGDMASTGLSWNWPKAEAVDDGYIGARGRVFDLIVLGRPGTKPQHPRMPPLEAALFESGRPVLIVPKTAPTSLTRHALISWNGSPEQAHTNTFALPVLRLAEQVTVLTVDGQATGGPSGEEAAKHLRRNGVKATAITVKPGDRSAGEVTLEQAATLGCDLLVKSAYTQSRLRQMIFGGATRHILANATLPILMAH